MTTIDFRRTVPGVGEPVAPYSLIAGGSAKNVYHFAGQCAVDASGAIMGETIEEQTEAVINNIAAVLSSVGLTWENVVKTTCYLVHPNDMAGFNQVRSRMLKELVSSGDYPANSLVFVKGLIWPELVVEIEGVAVV